MKRLTEALAELEAKSAEVREAARRLDETVARLTQDRNYTRAIEDWEFE